MRFPKTRHRSQVPKRWEKPKYPKRLTKNIGDLVMGWFIREFQIGEVTSVDIRIKLWDFDHSDAFRDTFLTVKWRADNKETRCCAGHVKKIEGLKFLDPAIEDVFSVKELHAPSFIILRNTTTLSKGDVFTWDKEKGVYVSALGKIKSWARARKVIYSDHANYPLASILPD